jgi:hypothetical protein
VNFLSFNSAHQKLYKETSSFASKPKSGRPSKLSEEQQKEIINLCEENRKRTSSQLNALCKEKLPEIKVSDSLIRRVLIKDGLHRRLCTRKPLLMGRNNEKRLAFALKYRDKPLDFWMKVLWSDEKQFQLFGTK